MNPAPASRIGPGLALAAAGSVAFSAKAIIVKLAYRHDVDAVTLIMYRMLFALPLFLALAWWSGRGRPPLAQRDWAVVAGLGFSGYYLASFLDFSGLQYITASLERLILYLNPTIVLVLGWLLFGHRVVPRQALALAVSYAGVLLVFGHEVQLTGSGSALGAALVFGSALSYAVYLVYSGREVRRLGALRLTGWATSVACALCIAQFLLLRPLSALELPSQVYALAIAMAVFSTVLPVFMTSEALKRIGANHVALVGALGPVTTIFFGYVGLDETMTVMQGVGAALVLGGVMLVTLKPAPR